ncbi:MAG: hypothetical protein FWE98_09000 [Oscillospiraceae bacterium]|nr:hypothetical protein [Oscillospiraceae bacterium]
MIAFLIIGVTGIAGVITLIRLIRLKHKGERCLSRGIACALLFAVCALQISLFYWEPTLPLKIDEEALKSFAVELETPEAYAQWFQPDREDESLEAYKVYGDALTMSKYLYKEPDAPGYYVYVYVQYFETEEWAQEKFERESSSFRFDGGKVTQISPDHEYICSRTTFGIAAPCTVIMAFLPDGSLSSEVSIRHKNVIYTFSEQTSWRRSRIDKAVEELWADYLKYLEENQF